MSHKTRITADFDPEAYQALTEVAKSLRTNKADAIRRALGLIQFLLKEKEQGMLFILEDKDGKTRKQIVAV